MNNFSFIHFSHVIEHVPNPAETLKEVYRILAKGGYLAITTPNADGIFAKKYKSKWRAVMPQHLWLFSKKTLSQYMKDIGFNIIKDFSWGSIPIEKNTNKFIKSFFDKYVKIFMLAAVAQLDRVGGYEPLGRGFESSPPHQKI